MTAPQPTSEGHPELAVAWVLHGLEPDEDAVFALHLVDCPGCRQIVAETEEISTLLGSAVPVVEPPPALRAALLAAASEDSSDASDASLLASSERKAPFSGEPGDEAVSDEPQRTPDVGAGPSSPAEHDATVVPLPRRGSDGSRGRWIRRATAGIAVAAVLALVVAIGGLVATNRSLSEQRDAATAHAAQRDEVVQLLDAASQPGNPHAVLATPAGGLVGLVVDRGRGPEVLVSGLAPADAGHTYVLWGLAGKTPVGLTTVEMSGSGPVVQSVPSVEAAGRFAGFAMSLEPGHSVPAAPTQVVASGQTTG